MGEVFPFTKAYKQDSFRSREPVSMDHGRFVQLTGKLCACAYSAQTPPQADVKLLNKRRVLIIFEASDQKGRTRLVQRIRRYNFNLHDCLPL
jgi:hypothetical protein